MVNFSQNNHSQLFNFFILKSQDLYLIILEINLSLSNSNLFICSEEQLFKLIFDIDYHIIILYSKLLIFYHLFTFQNLLFSTNLIILMFSNFFQFIIIFNTFCFLFSSGFLRCFLYKYLRFLFDKCLVYQCFFKSLVSVMNCLQISSFYLFYLGKTNLNSIKFLIIISYNSKQHHHANLFKPN